MIKCIAIDDQTESLQTLERYIADTKDMRLIAQYTDSVEALREISKGDVVDIIFMDVEMPRITGIELANEIRQKTKKLIFTTSHQKYAFDAYQAAGDGYLLKPYSYAAFYMTINRIFGSLQDQKDIGEYFLVKNKEEDHRALLIKYSDIVAFESFGNYIKIHTLEKTIIAYLSLKDVKEQLSLKERFVQFHRGYIIAIDKIKYIDGNSIHMQNELCMNVGDLYNENFREFLSANLIISSRKK